MVKTKINIQEVLKEQKPFKSFQEEDKKAEQLKKATKIKENKKTKQISLYLYEDEITLLDQLVKLHAGTRSSYLRKYILEQAKEANLY